MTGWHHAARSTSLAGTWKVRRADERSRRTVADLDLDDSAWAPAQVPGHWRNTEGLEDATSVLYRHRFESDARPGRRRWLSIDGLCYQGDIWLDGAYLGDTEGYFLQHVFDVSHVMRGRREHVVAIEATCHHPGDRLEKRNITGVLQHAEHLDHDLNPGGLWRDVRIEETGDIRIDHLRVLVLEADSDRAILRFKAVLDSAATHTATVSTLIDPVRSGSSSGASGTHHQELVLARGTNAVEWHVAVEAPDLWWPHSLGTPHLYDIRVEATLDGEISHVRKRRTGLRTIEMRNWVTSVNGERLFLKGANLGPGSIDLAATTAADHRRDLQAAADAGLDVLRVHGHIASPTLYREADQLGMLLWQDFPLQWGQAGSVRTEAVRQAERMIDQLGHHPSVILWSAHNEPGKVAHRPGHRDNLEPERRFGQHLSSPVSTPSWNRNVLDRAVRTAIAAADPTRPAIANSGVPAHPPRFTGTDSHLYFGWHHGEVADVAALAKRFPRLVRFVSEFGAQAIPSSEEIANAVNSEAFPQIDRERLAELGAQWELLERHTPMQQSASWEEWTDATQRYQAHLIRHTIEVLRTLKYRPCGGYCQFLFNDAMPFVSPAVLDHTRRPKLGYRALVEASRPVIVVADLHRQEIVVGTRRCTLHVVSDLRHDIEDATIDVTWEAPGVAAARWEFSGRFEADSVSRITRIRLVAPEAGPARLSLALRSTDLVVSTAYDVTVQ